MGVNEFIQIGNQIKQAREKKGLSRKDIAKEIGVSYSTYCNYEYGNREPNKETLEKIAAALEVSVPDLLSTAEIYKRAERTLQSFDPEQAFREYLSSIGYVLEKGNFNGKRKISSASDPEQEIYISDSELKTLEKTTKENIDLRINSFLHDGKHLIQ